MKYLKKFDFQLLYYLGKTNVVANALSQKERQSPHQQLLGLCAIIGELIAINLVLHVNGLLANFVISNYLIDKLKMTQVDDKEFTELMEKLT